MAQIQFNKAGVPLIGFGTSGMFLTTTGTPEQKPKKVSNPTDPEADETIIGKNAVANWGSGNKFPQDADELIKSIGVLNSGLKFIRNFTIGQGIFPVIIEGYDSNGDEILKPVNDPDLNAFAKGRMVRRYLEKAVRDYLKFGPAFVQLIPSVDGNSMVGINTINAKYVRLSKAKKGVIEKCFVSGMWPDEPDKTVQIFDVLDDYDPMADLQRRKWGNKITTKTFVQTITDSWSNNEYYSEPVWHAAHIAGWTDIAKKIPQFLLKAYENQITWKWHVQIPYAFWDKKFPKTAYENDTLRNDAINTYLDEIESNLCGAANASKPIFTMFEMNQQGKAEEQWIITPLESKSTNEANLITSAAANSELLFALMLNPNVLGAGMPGGTYAGNQGGSNIREAFLVNIANAWLDRQNLLDPLETFIRFNGADPRIEWRFRNTILTTLDTGSGTSKTLS